jgi:hypothetical protein
MCVLPVNDEAAVESTRSPQSGRSCAAAGFVNLLAIAEHNALWAPTAERWKVLSRPPELTGRSGPENEKSEHGSQNAPF